MAQNLIKQSQIRGFWYRLDFVLSCLAVPERLYLITDGGADRNIVNVSVQKGLISLFLKFDFDEVIAIRTAAYMSFYNPIERVHARCNLALQSVGMMRKQMSPQMEKILKTANSNEDVRNLCEKHPDLSASLRESLSMPVELLENLFGKLYLNESPFQILEPATPEEINEYTTKLNVFGDLSNLNRKAQIKDYPTFKQFLTQHTSARTYSFHIFKCSDPDCIFHEPLRGEPIEKFGEPVPKSDDGSKEYYVEGDDPEESHLPSKTANPEKQKHNIPFTPTAATAKNVGFTLKCSDCRKPRLLYAKKVLNKDEKDSFKRLQSDYLFSCGGSFDEIEIIQGDKDSAISQKVFTRDNLSCSSNVEIPYYSAGYPDVCIFCGMANNLKPSSPLTFPQCLSCDSLDPVKRTKRKKTQSVDLGNKKQKK